MSQLINTSEFDPVLDYINGMSYNPMENKLWLKIEIPPGSRLDAEKLKTFFGEDLAIHYENRFIAPGKKGVITFVSGTIKDKELATYLSGKILSQGVKIRMQYWPIEGWEETSTPIQRKEIDK